MSELYGITATIKKSEFETPVSSNTEVVVIGACKTVTEGLYKVTSWEQFKALAPEDGDTEFNTNKWSIHAAIKAMELANLDHIWVINCSNPDYSEETYEAEVSAKSIQEEGIKYLDELFYNYGVVPNIVVMPYALHHATDESITAKMAVQAISTKCKNIANRFKAQFFYDVPTPSSGAVADIIKAANQDVNEVAFYGAACYDKSISEEDTYIYKCTSLAALAACKRAVQDSQQTGRVPSRSVGNIMCNGIVDLCRVAEYDAGATFSFYHIDSTEERANEISSKGICTLKNIGQNTFVTWGDHTAAFSEPFSGDELARWDSNIAMNYHVCNRWVQKWRAVIDDPMTLSLRNDILHESQEYLDYLVSVGALIGSPKAEFRKLENTNDSIAKGQFYFTNILTWAVPAKYLDLGVVYTDAGLSAYVIE